MRSSIRVPLLLGMLGMVGYVLAVDGSTPTKRCGRHMVNAGASCAREGTTLDRVATICWTIVNGPRMRDTTWSARIRERWNGVLHQLDHTPSDAPAVTTHKSDIRLCTDHATSVHAHVYVCLHELAHIGVTSVGHTPEFWTCFRALLDQGIEMGLYRHDPDNTVCRTPIGPMPMPGKA